MVEDAKAKTEGKPKNLVVAKTESDDDEQSANQHEHCAPSSRSKSLRRSWKSASPLTKLPIIFTGVITLATVAYAIFAGWQLLQIRQGSRDTHNLAVAAKKQAEKAETISTSLQNAVRDMDAANSNARKALDASIAADQLEQRAWVGVVTFNRPKNLSAGKEASFGAAIKNTGKTPALDLTEKITATPFLKSQSFVPITTRTTTRPAIVVLQPGMTMTIWTLPQMRPNLPMGISRLKSGIEVMYVYGELSYEDIFHKTHRTHFCAWLDTDITSFNSCRAYNDAN